MKITTTKAPNKYRGKEGQSFWLLHIRHKMKQCNTFIHLQNLFKTKKSVVNICDSILLVLSKHNIIR